jgi:predicted dithiol-disulfide oxidoreductase (DUF899 family)
MPAMSPGLRHLSFPGESMEYRAARNALLVEEMELRRQIERVANQRRGSVAVSSAQRHHASAQRALDNAPVKFARTTRPR